MQRVSVVHICVPVFKFPMKMLGKRADFGRKATWPQSSTDFGLIDLKWREPLDVARVLAERPGFAFLDSAMFEPKLGRYSFIGIEPFGSFTALGGRAAWNGTPLEASPLEALRGLLAQFTLPTDPALPPFQGGVIGAVPTNSAGSSTV